MMPGKFRIEVAGRLARQEALRLEEQVYRRDHGFVSKPEEKAVYIIARHDRGSVVASFRVLGPEARPFEFESAAPLDFLRPDSKPALIGRLCVRDDYRSASAQVALHLGLLRAAFAHAEDNGFTDFVQFTFPRLVVFYRRALFLPVDRSYFHEGYRQRMELMHLDLQAVRRRLAAREPRALMLFGSESY